ncbi:17164_t:CDS:2, partial [Funneliformis geosporum]
MLGFYAIAEVVEDSNKRPTKTIFCYLTEGFGKHQVKSLQATARLVQGNGAQVFTSLEEVANYLNSEQIEARIEVPMRKCMNKKQKFDLQPLLTTKKILAKALKEGTGSELEEMGGVQAFEMAYELSEKYLETRNLTVHSYDADILAERNNRVMNLQLEEKHWNIIKKALNLCYREQVPLSIISRLREEFTESNLPFEV